LLEEIVGNIQDEYDEEEPDIARINETTYHMEGMTPLDEVGEMLGIEFPDEDFDTLAGLVISLLGRIPDENEKATAKFGNLQFKVLEMDDKRIAKIEVVVVPETESEALDDE